MLLHNRVNRQELIERLAKEPFRRVTLSFYRYVYFENPQEIRDKLYQRWVKLNCFGRIYLAHEGINAQMSLPEHHLQEFLKDLDTQTGLAEMPIKYAVEDDGKSFFKLTIKIRPKIVADGLPDYTYDVTNVGKHLSPMEFHDFAGQEGVLIVDMRNHYESEVGRFEGAFCPDADTFREAILKVEEELIDKKDQKLLLYCTGGIRCEKASAYLRHQGFSDVNQLHGGIIAYAHAIKQEDKPSKFVGKNFVFDQRLGEKIDENVIAHCHQCGDLCDSHTNCAHNDCHLLFIQCPSCATRYNGCCSKECMQALTLTPEEKASHRKTNTEKYAANKIFHSRLRPRLSIEVQACEYQPEQ
ncbi:MAG: rhodanese-related sulfurtransferase [Bacteroidota bacterium]|nr:MAG: rhodanese-related sulfurtransferase [Bacteroidota bacterium]